MLKRRLAIAACFLLVSWPAGAAPGRVQGWFVDSLVKVFPQTRPPAAAAGVPELVGARDAHLSLQLAVRSAADVAEVAGRVEPPRTPGGASIEDVVLRQVGYVVVGSNTREVPAGELVGEAPAWYPDVLWPLPASLKAGRTQAFWVTVHVPPGAEPGVYQGRVRLEAGGRTLVARPFRVRVVAATVPRARSLRVTNWFRSGDRESRQFFGAPLFSDAWWRLHANVASFMRDYRQNTILTPMGQLVQARVEDGGVRFDFSNFDRWVETFDRAGALDWIEGSHLLGRAGGYNEPLQVPAFVVEDGRAVRKELAPDDPRVEPAVREYLEALSRHLDEKNWKSRFLQHILDEPHGDEPASYGRFARLVRRHLPGVRIIDAIDAEHIAPEVEQYCDIWVPILGRFDDKVETLGRRVDGGSEVWFYVCLFPRGQYMNRLIDFPLIKTRLMHWLNFRYRLAGFLHWGWNAWSPDPVRDTQPVINKNETLLPAGDAFIVYPDRQNLTVHSSIRLEAMREGIEDYELLAALARSKPDEARKTAESAVRSFTDYVRDPAAFRRIHRRMLEALSR